MWWYRSQEKRKYGLIDITAREIVPCIFDSISNPYENLYIVRHDGKYGIIDINSFYDTLVG